MSLRSFIFGTGQAIIGQGLLSGLNLLLGLVFIRYAPKADYGVYLQFFAIILLSQSILGALFTGPMVTLAPKQDVQGELQLSAGLLRGQMLMSLSLALLCCIAVPLLAVWLLIPGNSMLIGLTFGLWLFGHWQREFLRDYLFQRHRPGQTLAIDFIYALALLVSLAASIFLADEVSLLVITAALAAACLISAAQALLSTGLFQQANWSSVKPAFVQAWDLGRWALPGVVVSWVYRHGYLYITAAMLGAAVTAEIGAARLLLMPIAIIQLAWENMFLPKASRWLGHQGWAPLRRGLLLSVVGLVGIIAVYLVVLRLAYGPLQQFLLGDEYADITSLIAVWGLYFFIRTLNLAGSVVMYAAAEFRLMFVYSLAAMLLGVTAIAALTYSHAALGAVIGLIIAEALAAVLIWLHGVPRVRRNALNMTSPA